MLHRGRLLLGLALLILLSSQGQSIPILDSAYENVKSQAIQSLSGTFNRKILVKEASGRILGQIVLHDVQIGPELYFDKFIINFNPIKYATSKGDIMPAITSLHLVGGRAEVIREKNGSISISNILKTGGDGPPFKAIIDFKDIEIHYKDEAGLPYKKKTIETTLTSAKGALDLRKSPKTKIAIRALGADLSSVSVIGEADIKNNAYKLKINAKGLSAKTLGNYFFPFFNFNKGSADIGLLASNDELILDVNGNVDDIPISVQGKVFNDLDVRIRFKNASSKFIKANFPELNKINVPMLPNGDIRITGQYAKPKIAASVKAFNGRIDCLAGITFAKSGPKVSINGKASGFSLSDLTGNSPGIKGQFDGSFSLDGTTSQFAALIDARLANASLWGEPVNKLSASLLYKNGGLDFKNIRISSKKGKFLGQGAMSKDRTFTLEAEAHGITLRGVGLAGKMELEIENFAGSLAFKADEAFLKSPIKNLTASGSIEIAHGRIGMQEISRGAGEIFMKRGAVSAKNMHLEQGKSRVEISGQTGAGIETDLRIDAKEAYLEDFGILGNLAQIDMQNTSGKGYLSIHAKGHLHEFTQLADLLNLNMEVRAGVSNGMFSGTQIKTASLEAEFSDGKLKNSNFYIKTYLSDLSGYLKFSKDEVVQSRVKGILDLSDLMPITARYGIIKGAGDVDFWASGPETNLQSNLNLNISNLRFNDILFDSINAGLTYNNKQNFVFFSRPLNIASGKTNLSLSGGVYPSKNPNETALNLDLTLLQSDAENTAHLLYKIYSEAAKALKPVLEDRMQIDEPKLAIKTRKTGKDNVPSDYFKEWDLNASALEKYKETVKTRIVFDKISGRASGHAKITGTAQNPTASLDITVGSGAYGSYSFDRLDSNVKINMESADVKKVSLKKGSGALNAKGSLSFATKYASIEISINDLPIDILNLIVPGELLGSFTGACNISGNLASPSYSGQFTTKPITLKGVEFKRAEAVISGNARALNIGKFILTEKNNISSMSGRINMDGDMDIKGKISGQSLGVINLFTDEIRWVNGDSNGVFHVKSQDGKINADGSLSIEKGVWHIKQLNSDIGMGRLSLEAQNGEVLLKEFSGNLYTPTNKISPFSIYGIADLQANKLDLKAVDGKISVDLPKLFSGDLFLKDVRISGPINKPALLGEVTLRDSLIYLLQAQQVGQSALPLGLDLDLNIDKNVYITTGSIDPANLSSVLNNILLNIEVAGDEIAVQGDLDQPQIKGKVAFGRGTANIFSREFALLSSTEQAKFYPLAQEKISDNYAEFSGNIIPNLNVIALVKVQSTDEKKKDPLTGFPLKKDVFVISRLTGTPLSKDKEKSIKIEFEAFEKDASQTISGYKQSTISQDGIKTLLLPDFIKGIAGEKGSGQTDANAMVADYLNSQLQMVVFRGLERQLEQSLGLESLTLNYNFGGDLRRALGSKDMSTAEKQTLGVGFVKGFYDKLFIEVHYAQALEDPSSAKQLTSINYQITYKLSPGLSVSYYKEPVSINTITEGYNKVSLRTGFLF